MKSRIIKGNNNSKPRGRDLSLMGVKEKGNSAKNDKPNTPKSWVKLAKALWFLVELNIVPHIKPNELMKYSEHSVKNLWKEPRPKPKGGNLNKG